MKFKKTLATLLSISLLLNYCQKPRAMDPVDGAAAGEAIKGAASCVANTVSFVSSTLSAVGVLIMVAGPTVKIVYGILDQRKLEEEIAKFGGYRTRIQATKCILDIVAGKSPIRIYGQERAKQCCREVLAGCLENIYRMPGKSDLPSVRNARGNVVYMIGRSGVGKTTMAYAIAEAFLKSSDHTCIFINSSQINREQPLGEQLFKLTTKVVNLKKERGLRNLWGALDSEDYCADARVAAPMLAHLIKWDGKVVVIIDEYDKMKIACATEDSPDGEDKSADEIIKSIADTGSYRVGTEVIDCTKALFLITTNESREQLEANFGYRGAVGGGVQRLNVIEFDDLSEDCCKKIIGDMVSSIKESLTSPWGDYKIKSLSFSEETLNAMADYIRLNEAKQGRAKTNLEQKIYDLFCYELEENVGKSFEVQYTPSDEAGEIGEFSKSMTEDRDGLYGVSGGMASTNVREMFDILDVVNK